MVAEFLKTGAFDRHLRGLRTALKNQITNTALAIARHFPDGTRITAPQGGLTLWVELNKKGRRTQGFSGGRKTEYFHISRSDLLDHRPLPELYPHQLWIPLERVSRRRNRHIGGHHQENDVTVPGRGLVLGHTGLGAHVAPPPERYPPGLR